MLVWDRKLELFCFPNVFMVAISAYYLYIYIYIDLLIYMVHIYIHKYDISKNIWEKMFPFGFKYMCHLGGSSSTIIA